MLEFFANVSTSEIWLVRFLESRLHCGLMQRRLGSDEMYWSRGMFTILDLDPAVDKPSFSLLQSLQHPDDRVSIERANANIEAAKPLTRRYRVIRHDGTMRVIAEYIEMLFDSAGKPDRSIGVICDVTEQAGLEAQTKLLEKRFEAITRYTGLIVNILRPDGAVTGIVGSGPEHDDELNRRLGYLWKDLIHPEDVQATLASFKQAVDNRQLVIREHRIKQRDGEYRWRRSIWTPVLDDQSNLKEFVSVSEDIEGEKVVPKCSGKNCRITGAQIRAARGIARWSVQQLADTACISPSVIRRIEDYDGVTEGIADTLSSICDAFAKANVEFIFPRTGKPAVRLA
ncbi:MAG: PAS domain-containing protein [Xanthobacteraceae bacterium]|nr:PAS domain-containing protein [Xanthobacteraceae bacterium]QYK44487.1 MAG: PAS domain-containing protein [Xanthobacteraceae bacterium]